MCFRCSGISFSFSFFLYLSLSLSFVCLCIFPFFFFSCRFFSFLSINLFHLYAAFAELHTPTLFSLLFTANLDWGIFVFAGKQQSTLIILIPFLSSPFPVYGSAACSSKFFFFLSPSSLVRPTERNNLFEVLNTHFCRRGSPDLVRH